jgi:drug/metabolite transporter (DMT)-like permease
LSRPVALLILLICAMLEVAGDALARKGMHAESQTARIGFYAMAAAVLFFYGWLVNRPPWSFGALLGIYVVLFFVVAQAVSWVFFNERPTPAIWIGGVLIVSGGVVMSVWRA